MLILTREVIARDLYDAPAALVRPDQIVGWRGDCGSSQEAGAIFNMLTGGAGSA